MRASHVVILAALLAASPDPSAFADPIRAGRVEFEVLRGGRPFGRQGVVVSQSGANLVAETSADLRADLGPVTLFRYRQNCREVWREGRLLNLSCTTLKNGRTQSVEGVADSDGLRVSGAGGALRLPTETWPTTWWTRPRLGSHTLINVETGRRLPVRVSLVGRETINVAGERISADRIRVVGSVTLDLWYDERGSWVGAQFTASGQDITYRLLTPRAEGPA